MNGVGRTEPILEVPQPPQSSVPVVGEKSEGRNLRLNGILRHFKKATSNLTFGKLESHLGVVAVK